MIACGAKEILTAAHDQVEAAWAAYCEANGELVKANAKLKVSAEKYIAARKNWLSTVERCTPGQIEEAKNGSRTDHKA